jgi:hypothetical protein
MNFDEAKLYLLLNGSGTSDADGNPLVQDDGFLGTLRPYQGLKDDNFHNVMEALFVVGNHFSESSHVDRELVSSIWWMCNRARLWGIDPEGMLRRNNLITDEDVSRLAEWIDVIEYTTLNLLNGNGTREAINTYAQYICEYGAGSNAVRFVPLLASAIDGDELHDPSTIAEALGRLGSLARPALPKLREAATRTYTLAQPIERFTAEVQATIKEAISKIEAE